MEKMFFFFSKIIIRIIKDKYLLFLICSLPPNLFLNQFPHAPHFERFFYFFPEEKKEKKKKRKKSREK